MQWILYLAILTASGQWAYYQDSTIYETEALCNKAVSEYMESVPIEEKPRFQMVCTEEEAK